MASKTFPGTTLGQLRKFFVDAQAGDTLLIPNDVVDGSDLPGGSWTTVELKDNITIIGRKTGRKVRIGGNGSSPANFTLDKPMFMSYDLDPSTDSHPIDGITIENIHLSVDITCDPFKSYAGVKIGAFIQEGKNVHFKDCEVSGLISNDILVNIHYVGGFIALISEDDTISTFINCVNRCSIKVGGWAVGGIVGESHSPIQLTNCVNYSDIQADQVVAGLVGAQTSGGKAMITDCVNHGVISSTGASGTEVGFGFAGICGEVWGDEVIVSGCHNFGNVYGSSFVAGLFYILQASTSGLVKDCSNNAIIQCEKYVVAGIIASCSGRVVVKNCHNAGRLEQGVGLSGYLDVNNSAAGGIIAGAVNIAAILNCTNNATISSSGLNHVAGIVAQLMMVDVADCEVAYCINRGNIVGNSKVGGIVGIAIGFDDNTPVLIHDNLNRGTVTSVPSPLAASSPELMSSDVGGIAGQVYSSVTIEDCVTCGSVRSGSSEGVTATDGSHVGGIVGSVQYILNIGLDPLSGTTKIHNNYSAVAFVSGVGEVHRVLGAFKPQLIAGDDATLELYDNYAYGGMRITGNNKLYQTITGLDINDDPIYTDVTPYSYDYNHFITPPQSGGVYDNAIIPKKAPDYGLNRYDGSNLIRLGDCSDYWGITDIKTHVRFVGCGHPLRAGMFGVWLCSQDDCTYYGDATNDAKGDFDIKPILITAPGTYCLKIMMAGSGNSAYTGVRGGAFLAYAVQRLRVEALDTRRYKGDLTHIVVSFLSFVVCLAFSFISGVQLSRRDGFSQPSVFVVPSLNTNIKWLWDGTWISRICCFMAASSKTDRPKCDGLSKLTKA
ncbi:hypothetical protein AGMMS49992_24820 [Clostridia bacterium]|nr:hypothetical protein AGMMS49992_24820 [Clostridia bacterium]